MSDARPAGGGRLGPLEIGSYGFGDFGFSLAYNMAGAFLLYYYTNVVMLPAAAVGTIFLVARLLDAQTATMTYNADAPLRPSGLIGPVRLLVSPSPASGT